MTYTNHNETADILFESATESKECCNKNKDTHTHQQHTTRVNHLVRVLYSSNVH